MILDVSLHQGIIDWKKLKAATTVRLPTGAVAGPIEGVIIKLTGAEIGKLFRDPQGKRNWQEARAAGMRIGAYHFQNGALNSESGRDEAEFFLATIDAYGGMKEGDFLPTVDVEWPITPGDFDGKQLDDFVETMADEGCCLPVVYGGRWHLDAIPNRDHDGITKYCPFWIAAYARICPAPPAPWDHVALWQFTDKGRVDGIDGYVDVNKLLVPIGHVTQ